MKNFVGLLAKLALLISLCMASLPSVATETVCVLDSGKQTVPVAKCGMPCCAKPAPVVQAKRDCCAKKAEKLVPETKHFCAIANEFCHCETRLVPGASRGLGTTATALQDTFENPSALPYPTLVASNAPIREKKDQTAELDTGPPRKLPRPPSQPRAPPTLA